ncbi:MAG: CRISPR-associated protein Csx19 [Oscillochloridaceae bacterium umkhey_bin13]
MKREIKTLASTCTVTAVTLPDDLAAWLTSQAQTYGLCWLLAYDDSGVIWGKLRDGHLHLSSDDDAFPRPSLRLRTVTLQQARLFGSDGELLLWRGPNNQWRITLRLDGQGDEVDYFDEAYMLWGYREEAEARNGFRELREGSEGIVHAPPLERTPSERERAKLSMRHYLTHDPNGMVRTVASRFVSLQEAEV